MENKEFSKEQIEALYTKVERSVLEHLKKKMPYHFFYFSELKATEQSHETEKIILGTEIFRIEIAKHNTASACLAIIFHIVPDENNQQQAIRIRGAKDAPKGFSSILRSSRTHFFFEEFILPQEHDLDRKLFGLSGLLTVMLEDLSIRVTNA